VGLPATLPGPVPQPPSTETPIYTQKSLINYATRNVQPPAEVYVTVNDAILYEVWNSIAGLKLQAVARILRADGQIITTNTQLLPTSDRLINNTTVALPEGFVLSVMVYQAGPVPLRGQCFVNISILRGPLATGVGVQQLASDYVTAASTVAWPGGRQISSVEGPGLITTRNIAAPGAGNVVRIQPPTNARWRLLGFLSNFTTSAVAANRRVVLLFVGAVGTASEVWAATTQAATLTYTYVAGKYGYAPPDAPPNPLFLSLLEGIDLSNGAIGQLTAQNMDVGDSFTGANIFVEEWIEPTQ